MITKIDLELQFRQSTGLSKDHNPKKYEEWIENYLLEELNKEKEEDFMQNDFFVDGGER
jgi:hypothetical protein